MLQVFWSPQPTHPPWRVSWASANATRRARPEVPSVTRSTWFCRPILQIDARPCGSAWKWLRKALPPKVLDSEEAARFAASFPDLVAELGLDDEAIRELAGGVRDVFAAACADPLSGLHGPPGKPCPARPWVCLLCPLAVFAPRHVPNLMRLNAYFSRQFLAMPIRQFLAVFGPYPAQRIETILGIFAERDAALLTSAGAEIADNDDELPPRAEELSL